ncbi:MAG: alanyl-tRNA synthetase [uncultured archaeon A07HB70]|nr:MAG: alanyl-tRNA synthetase [uncultured archaeon A07HB70]
MPTKRIYLRDTARRRFEARVDRTLADPPRVVLGRTCFYPSGGGQPHDTGELRADGRTWRVVDVSGRETVEHEVTGAPLPDEGTTVEGVVDADRRQGHERHHTAQHLLSAVLLSVFDAETTGNQVYADRARIDCAYPRFDDADLARIEERLNTLVDADLPVRWYERDRAAAERDLDPTRTRIGLLPDAVTEVRIVEVGDPDDPFDRTACAGTHVASTGAVGTVTVTGRETKGPETERVRFRVD